MLPKTIEVSGNVYRVIRVPDPLVKDGERLSALIDHEQEVVWIDPKIVSVHHIDKTIEAVRERIATELADADDDDEGGVLHAA